MKTLRALSVSERLAVVAGVAAAIASLAGFIPGVYRDPKVVIAQSHGTPCFELVLPPRAAKAAFLVLPPVALGGVILVALRNRAWLSRPVWV